MARGYVEHRGQRSSGKDGLPATLDMNREFGQTSIWWPLRFLTSVLNPGGFSASGWLRLYRAPCSQGEAHSS